VGATPTQKIFSNASIEMQCDSIISDDIAHQIVEKIKESSWLQNHCKMLSWYTNKNNLKKVLADFYKDYKKPTADTFGKVTTKTAEELSAIFGQIAVDDL
jgi:hypothetical protein